MADGQAVTDSPLEFAARCARALAGADDLDDVLETLLQAAIDQTDAGAGGVFILDEDRRELVLAVGVGIALPDPGSDAPSDGSGQRREFVVSLDDDDPLAKAVDGATTVALEAGSPDVSSRLLRLCGLAAGLLVPLSVVREGIDQAVGVLGICWAGGLPPGDAPVAIALVADLVAVAIDRARAVSARAEQADWQERLAHSDPLTGLANRRTFDRMLELEIARAARQGSEVTVVVFDVDAFGETNRVAGRAAGDAVLRTVATILAESVRLVDTVGRYGADEFVVVAPGSAGSVVARRVLEGIAGLGEVAGRRVSVSAGVARFPADGATAEELLRSAGAALTDARGAGGGTIGTVGATPAV